MRDDSAKILLQPFLQEALVSSSGVGTVDVVRPAFPLPTTASPTFQGDLTVDFGEAVVAYDISEPCKFPSLDCCQKRFLWTHKEVDLAPHQSLVLYSKWKMQRGFLIHLVSTAWILFFRVSKQGPCFTHASLSCRFL